MVSQKKTLPTPYPDLNAVLQVLVGSIRENLGGNFVGVYLQGSFAVGDFDLHSDVDFIVAIEEELSSNQVDMLQVMHGRIYDLESHWAQHLEGSYFPKEILRTIDRRGKELWYLDNGSRSLVQSDHCNSILVRWVVRESGIALAGPPAESLVDSIPVEKLRQDILNTIIVWGGEILAEPERYNNRFYQTYIVLNLCRMLHDLVNGFPGSKRAGAEWAKMILDPKWIGLIERTWDGRPNPEVSVRQPADSEDFAGTLKFVQYIIDQSKLYTHPFGLH